MNETSNSLLKTSASTTGMTEAAAKQICSWNYEPPYSVYNYSSYEDALKSKAKITQSEYSDSFLCFWNKDDKLIAYVSMLPKGNKVFLGIGLAPDCCGKGLGKKYLMCGIEAAFAKYGANADLWLQVRAWNKRAIKCYSSCGFRLEYREAVTDRFGKDEEFCFMRYINNKQNGV